MFIFVVLNTYNIIKGANLPTVIEYIQATRVSLIQQAIYIHTTYKTGYFCLICFCFESEIRKPIKILNGVQDIFEDTMFTTDFFFIIFIRHLYYRVENQNFYSFNILCFQFYVYYQGSFLCSLSVFLQIQVVKIFYEAQIFGKI